MEKKKILVIILIIACFCITGCQENNSKKDIENATEEVYEGGNEKEKTNKDEDETKEIFTITFDSDGGTPIELIKVTAGEKIIAPTEPTKEGHKFLGWYNGETLYDFNIAPNQNLVLKAKWEKNAEQTTEQSSEQSAVKTYTVTFNSNGGTTVGSQKVKSGSKVPRPYDPAKSGYSFVMWELNGKAYDFNTKVTKNITLNAVWLLTPKITEGGFGAVADGTVGKQLKLDSTAGIIGIEIYSSTSENGTYTLLKTVKTEDWNETTSTVYAKKGEHLYFKVKTYVVRDSKTYKSGYSNVIEINNSLSTPKITEGGFGAVADGTVGKQLELDSTAGITGIEIYSSTSENGTYILLKTVKTEDWNETTSTVYAKKGEHLYFKVKTYVVRDSKTYKSGYSNVIEINNSLSTPKITEGGFGAVADGTVGKQLELDSTAGITGIEIYSSTSENGTYTLLKTVKIEDWNETTSTVYAKKGEHLYFKVKTYVVRDSKTYKSGYSNVIEINNL